MAILVVDDNPLVLLGTSRVLRAAGYTVIEASTGEEGLRLVRERRPDLVLMDVCLPGISGLEAVQEIKADPELATIFVVIISASATSSERQAGGLDVGAEGYIVRPIPYQELLARVNAFLRQKKIADALRASEALFASSFEFAPIGMALATIDGRWMKVNRVFCELLGRSESQLLGVAARDITHPEEVEADREKHRRLLAGEIRAYQLESRYVHLDGHVINVSVSVSLLRDAQNEPDYLIIQIQDITERLWAKAQMAAALEKEAILRREMHHRVKNNLQLISSLLYLQSQQSRDLPAQEALRDSQLRVRSIALIHERLYASKDLLDVNFGEYVRKLAVDLFTAYQTSEDGVALAVFSEDVALDLEHAIPCGFIVNELVSNALKHAFPSGRKGEISIRLESIGHGADLALSVHDDGVGLPAHFDWDKGQTLGLKLVRDLTRQLAGTLRFQSEHGTLVKVTFPNLRITPQRQ